MRLAAKLDGTLHTHTQSTDSHKLMQLTDVELEALFREWWAQSSQSYPTPPGTHALLTHIGWGRYLLKRVAAAAEAAEQ